MLPSEPRPLRSKSASWQESMCTLKFEECFSENQVSGHWRKGQVPGRDFGMGKGLPHTAAGSKSRHASESCEKLLGCLWTFCPGGSLWRRAACIRLRVMSSRPHRHSPTFVALLGPLRLPPGISSAATWGGLWFSPLTVASFCFLHYGSAHPEVPVPLSCVFCFLPSTHCEILFLYCHFGGI